MNLDELKKTWKEYDQRLSTQSLIHEKLVKNLLKEKSHSTLDQMRRGYVFTFLYILAFVVFCVLSVLYNAFDFTHILQYIPLVLYILASLVLLVLLMNGFKITKMEIDKENLLGSIQKVLHLHRKFISRTGKAKIVFVLSGFLFPFSFFPRIYANKGAWPAVGLVVFTVALIAVLFFLFRFLGLFKDRHEEKLVETLQELEEYEELNAESGRMG